MTQRVIHVGVGSFGQRWCREWLAGNTVDGTIEVVAVVDIRPEAAALGGKILGLPPERCFADAATAFAAVPADFCTIAVPPEFHEAVVDAALVQGLDILCEKPIADTMAGAARVVRKVRESGRKMAVTMSHRFDQDKTTLRHDHPVRRARSGQHGELPLRRRHAQAHGLGRAVPPHSCRIR